MKEHFLALIRGEKRGPWAALQKAGLFLLSLPYSLGMRVRNLLYDAGWKKKHGVAIPVICVGNLTVGGTGKTPCVEYVARWYRDQNLRVAILSRGYGSQQGANDEALLLEENLPDVPHLQGADRVALAKIAMEELESEVLILDDGMQHRRLERKLNIVLLDATCPWGFGHVLPRGLLREPLSGLRRAGVVLLTRCNQVSQETVKQISQRVQRIAPGLAIVQSIHRPMELVNSEQETGSLAVIREKPVAAFCGLGNPTAFQKTLEEIGAKISSFRTFPDHHSYRKEDIEDLRCWARQQAKDCVVVTTQKDLVKIRLSQIGERPLFALRIQLEITEGKELLDRKLKEALA